MTSNLDLRSRTDFACNSDLDPGLDSDSRPGSGDPDSTSVLDLGFPPKSDSVLPWISGLDLTSNSVLDLRTGFGANSDLDLRSRFNVQSRPGPRTGFDANSDLDLRSRIVDRFSPGPEVWIRSQLRNIALAHRMLMILGGWRYYRSGPEIRVGRQIQSWRFQTWI